MEVKYDCPTSRLRYILKKCASSISCTPPGYTNSFAWCQKWKYQRWTLRQTKINVLPFELQWICHQMFNLYYKRVKTQKISRQAYWQPKWWVTLLAISILIQIIHNSSWCTWAVFYPIRSNVQISLQRQ